MYVLFICVFTSPQGLVAQRAFPIKSTCLGGQQTSARPSSWQKRPRQGSGDVPKVSQQFSDRSSSRGPPDHLTVVQSPPHSPCSQHLNDGNRSGTCHVRNQWLARDTDRSCQRGQGVFPVRKSGLPVAPFSLPSALLRQGTRGKS